MWKDFKSFFVGNNSTYAIQNNNGNGYNVIRNKIDKELILKHLNKEITIGSYPIYRKRNRICCKWICVDIDLHSFELENGIEVLNSRQIKNGISYPIRLNKKNKKGKNSAFFNTQNELLDYYWSKSGLIVYEQISMPNENEKNNYKEFWIDDVQYFYKEKYRIECDEKDKLGDLVNEIENFIQKFYRIPKNAICRESSGRGYHIWINLKDMTTLKRAYDFSIDIKTKILQFFGIEIDEIFPKQPKISDTVRCPYCKETSQIPTNYKEETITCNKCEQVYVFNGIFKLGLGNFVKLPLSINRNNKKECIILDNDFDLTQQQDFEITDLVKEMREIRKKENYYDRNKREIELGEWKPLDNMTDNGFYDQLRYCLRKIVVGWEEEEDGEIVRKYRQAIGGYGHNIRRCIANELFKLKAPLSTRINAFRGQKDFDPQTSEFQCKDLEMRQRRNNRFYVSSCRKIAEWGFCYPECPERHKAKQISEIEMADMLLSGEEHFGIKGGWVEARKLFSEKINGKTQTKEYVIKTTRSGTTTNIIVETIENNKKILVVAPTIRICEITVEDAIKLTDKNPKLFRLGSNKELCLLLGNKIANANELSRFPFLLKENCKECQYSQMEICDHHTEYNKECEDCKKINRERPKCDWRRAIEDIEENDIIYITTAKIHALMKTSDQEAKGVLKKIFNTVDVIFLDEISSVLDVGSEGIAFIGKSDPMYQTFTPNINFPKHFKNEYELLTPYVLNKAKGNKRNLEKIWFSLNDFVNQTLRVHKQWKHLYQNNMFLKIDSPLWRILREIDEKNKEKNKKGSADADWLMIYKILTEYTETHDYYPTSIVQILILAKYSQFYLQYTTPARYDLRLDLLPAKPIREFLDFLNKMAEIKQFFCTDATEPPIDIKKLFPNIEMLEINDPMNTAKKQTVIPDNQMINVSKMGKSSQSFKEAVNFVKNNGNKNTMVICQNIAIARMMRKVLKKNEDYHTLTYFRSPYTIGTPSKCRTIITIGSPYPPKNSHRWLADLFLKENLADKNMSIDELTKHLEYYNAKSTFFQAISRGKDPRGKIESFVFTYGLNKFQCIQLLKFPIAVPNIQ